MFLDFSFIKNICRFISQGYFPSFKVASWPRNAHYFPITKIETMNAMGELDWYQSHKNMTEFGIRAQFVESGVHLSFICCNYMYLQIYMIGDSKHWWYLE